MQIYHHVLQNVDRLTTVNLRFAEPLGGKGLSPVIRGWWGDRVSRGLTVLRY